MSLNVLIILLLPLIAYGELNFNNDLEHNQKFKSMPTTVKTYENHTVLLPCERDSKLQKVTRYHITYHIYNIAKCIADNSLS